MADRNLMAIFIRQLNTGPLGVEHVKESRLRAGSVEGVCDAIVLAPRVSEPIRFIYVGLCRVM